MCQKYTIEDLDPTKEYTPFYFRCAKCGVILDGVKANDNRLGRDEGMCKHWCDKCFRKIKKWIRKQKENLNTNDDVKEKEVQTKLNFNKNGKKS